MTGVILIGGVDNWNKQMKLLFENWRGYIKESNSGTVEERILNDIFSGKTLEEIKTQYKFSSPEKERIVEGAYEYVTNSNRPAAFNTILSTYKVLFSNRSHKDDVRNISYYSLGWMALHGGGLKLAARKDIADIENLEDKGNRQRIFQIIKNTHPEFMKFLSYVRLVVGSQNKKMKFKELIKVHEMNHETVPIEKKTASLGVDII